VGASAAQAQPGVAPLDRVPFPADAPDHPDWGPAHHWCPGEEPVTTGNHITDPLNWDWNVCHTYYYVWPGMGNVSSLIWDGENPPPKPPPAPALNFCPIPPWCP
jgi:hypothetical protein